MSKIVDFIRPAERLDSVRPSTIRGRLQSFRAD